MYACSDSRVTDAKAAGALELMVAREPLARFISAFKYVKHDMKYTLANYLRYHAANETNFHMYPQSYFYCRAQPSGANDWLILLERIDEEFPAFVRIALGQGVNRRASGKEEVEEEEIERVLRRAVANTRDFVVNRGHINR